MFDALFDTLDRIDGVEGHKYVILVGTGYDSFSKHTLDDTLKKVKTTQDVTIFTISTGGMLRERADPYMGSIQRLDFLQADNQMETFARMTGGMHFKPVFEGQMPEVMRDIAGVIRNQYTLTYHPSNTKLDGTYRKLKVELVDPEGKPLQIAINGKKTKYNIVARDGYFAKHEVE
jgi:VWFA-related protein